MVAGKCRDADRHWHAFSDGRWASRGQFDPAFITTFYHPAVDLSNTNAGPMVAVSMLELRTIRALALFGLALIIGLMVMAIVMEAIKGDTLGVDRRIFHTALNLPSPRSPLYRPGY